MAAKPRDKTPAEVEERTELTAAIRSGILSALGRPEGLLRVGVYPLWGDSYRINILVGPDPATARVTDSFFVVVDDRGAVVRSVPTITRRY